MNRKQADNLTSGQRTQIRKSSASDRSLAIKYGVTAAIIGQVRATAGVQKRGAAKTAKPRKKAAKKAAGKAAIPAVQIRTDGLHVEGGPDLPQLEH